jgi:predicted nucleic acid-binding protein
MRVRFAGRLLAFDAGAAERWGQVEAFSQRQWLTLPTVDAQLAATALHLGLTLVTRNTEDVRVTGVPLCNPWTSRP